MAGEFRQNFPLVDHLSHKDKVNIKFISGTIPFNNAIHINPSFWIIKSWYSRQGKNNHKINWLDSIHYNSNLCENEIEKIVKNEQPDIICFGLYIWNYSLYSRLGKFIKERWPHIILLGGGPEIYAHKELDLFWENNNWLDAVVYGDGEEAFTVLVDNIINSKTASSDVNNISYRVNNQNYIETFKRFKNNEFNYVSPFSENIDLVKKAIKQIQDKNSNLEIIMNWEFTKGCPYSCSFCDWSSGLHHKVTRKSYDWKIDLDLFSSLDISVRWVDANIGMFKDDIDVIKYAYELEDKNPKFKLTFNNLAKLNKKAVFSMIDFMETSRPGTKIHTMTVQDINENVLENIDRPDIAWPLYKNLIIDTKNKHSKFTFDIETMLGMPGQTLETYAQNIIEFAELKPRVILGHIWCMLINSPGYNKDYRLKHNLRVVPALHFTRIPEFIKNRDDVEKYIDDCEYYSASTVVGTNTATLADIMAMNGMVMLYNNLIYHLGKIDLKVISKVYSNINYWQEFGYNVSKELEKDLLLRNKMLLLVDNNGIPNTFNQYFGNKDTIVQIIKSAY